MNYSDSEKINMILNQSWFIKIEDENEADLIIFNTCSVRKKGEDRVFWYINNIIKKNKKEDNSKKTIVWITWCMVRKTWMNIKYLNSLTSSFQMEKGKFKRKTAKKIENLSDKKWIYNNDDKLFPIIPELDFTLRIEDIKYIPFLLGKIYNESFWIDDKFDDYLKQKQLRENPSSASIVVQTWCDNYCSYCIVPYTRWRENSRSIKDIIEEAKIAVKWWAKEIILVGQNVNSYWKEFKKDNWDEENSKWKILIKTSPLTPLITGEGNNNCFKSPFRLLLEELDKIEWLDRIRFTSSNPHDMTDDILSSHFELNNTCPYLHFALQSWSNEILKKMNRKHSYEDFKKQVEYLRKNDPLFCISTDIIVWFPWETEKMFEETIQAFKELQFDFVYIARYSVRSWTLASKLYPDDISEKVKSQRWHILNDLLLENVLSRNKLMIWRKEQVLVIWKKDWFFFWRTRNFKEVFFRWGDYIKIWDYVNLKIEEMDRYVLRGKVMSFFSLED